MKIKLRIINTDGSINGWIMDINGTIKYVQAKIKIKQALEIFKTMRKSNGS